MQMQANRAANCGFACVATSHPMESIRFAMFAVFVACLDTQQPVVAMG